MGFFSGAKKTLGHVFDFRFDHWADVRGIKNTTLYLWHQAKQLCSPQKSQYSETFEEAINRLALSNERLGEQAKRYQYLFIGFIGYAVFLIIYGAAILLSGNWIGGIISFALSLYSLALAFRFHFWRFQITQQKLGCTLKEWFKSLVSAKRTIQL